VSDAPITSSPNGVALDRGDDSAGSPISDRERDRDERELDPVAGKRAANSGEDRLVGDDRDAEVAAAARARRTRRTARERAVEPELVDQPLVALRRHSALARQRLDRIARE
jgi:hypothetical protein